jgi:hypothetical protein
MSNWIKKDGVSDADLIAAARDMHKALGAVVMDIIVESDSRLTPWVMDKALAALAKVRGEGRS